MAFFEFPTRVAYGDVDAAMHLSLHGAMGLMQEAAIIHSDMIGYSVRHIPQTRLIWMLVRWRVRLLEDALWNENVIVRTWPRTMERVTSDREFEIIGENGRRVAIGSSSWVLVSADTGRIVRIPAEVAAAYDLTELCVFDDDLPDPVEAPGELTYSGKVLKRDIDTNHHVNNRVYLQIADEAIADKDEKMFREVMVKYRRQLLLGQEVRCFSRKEDKCWIVDICSEDDTISATVMYR